MNAAIVPFRLIIIDDSQEEAQRLTSMFQNAGKPCRAQHINSQEAFHKIIEEQAWDLIIANSNATSLAPATAIRSIRKYNHDIPVILLADAEATRAVVDGMKMGACDVVNLDNDQHLLLVVARELDNRQQRKATRRAERKLKEIERRNRQLLDSSKDGIAFIQDGTCIYANDSFAEMCGYSSRDDIEYMPLMDLIEEHDQEAVKNTLKQFVLQETSDSMRIGFRIKTASDNFKAIEPELHAGEFEDEACIQLLLPAIVTDSDRLAAEIETIKQTDSVTGLSNRVFFNEHLNGLIEEAAETEKSRALIYIDLDQFESKIQSTVGIDGADDVLKTVAEFLMSHCNEGDFLSRLSDHAFAITTEEYNFEKLLNSGNVLCEHIRNHFFEVKNKTLRLTCSIGIAGINEASTDAQSVINQAVAAIESLRNKQNNAAGDGVNVFQNQQDDQAVLGGCLQKALNDNRFRLLFQPIISLHGDETERYEVLLRMIDDNNEEVSPSHFLQTAESMRMVNKLDRWVLLEAIKHLSNQKTGHTQLLVNISHESLCDESLLPWLKVAFSAAKIKSSSIMLQAREVDIAQHLSKAKQFIEQAVAAEIGFCVTHFGCELDPLALLEHIGSQHIRIDGSFALELQDNLDNTEALEQLVKGLKQQQKTITVPMVESASILSKLWKMGIHNIQGNYLQPPSTAMDYEFSVENTG